MYQKRLIHLIGAAIAPAVLALAAVPAMATPVTYGGVTFPGGDASFADHVANFVPGPDTIAPYNDPADAVDPPDYVASTDTGSVALGYGGLLDLQFTDNSLTTSGDTAEDLWVFEVGGAVEPMYVYVSQNGSTWTPVGSVGGATAGVDLDAFIGSGITVGALYSFVRLVDQNVRYSGYPYAGADVDAVGAISSGAAVPHPSVPEPNGVGLLILGLAVVGGMGVWRRRGSR